MDLKERKELLKTLKEKLKNITFPKEPVSLNDAERVVDCDKFVKAHLLFIESYIGLDICLPYFQRLINFINKIQTP